MILEMRKISKHLPKSLAFGSCGCARNSKITVIMWLVNLFLAIKKIT